MKNEGKALDDNVAIMSAFGFLIIGLALLLLACTSRLSDAKEAAIEAGTL